MVVHRTPPYPRGFRRPDLQPRDRSTPRILDVGCGTGANLLMLKQYGEAEGVDVSMLRLRFVVSAGWTGSGRARVKSALRRRHV